MIGNYGVVFLNCRGFEFHLKFSLYILSKISLWVTYSIFASFATVYYETKIETIISNAFEATYDVIYSVTIGWPVLYYLLLLILFIFENQR